jgi:heme-degrading monooxygenase HmoA
VAPTGQPYTSGDWVVQEGKEQEFIAAWTELADWSKANARGSRSFALIQQADEASHFLSFGAWDDSDAVEEWRSRPEFRERLGACRELCTDFQAHDYRLVAGG